jgi:hypothetical protein
VQILLMIVTKNITQKGELHLQTVFPLYTEKIFQSTVGASTGKG